MNKTSNKSLLVFALFAIIVGICLVSSIMAQVNYNILFKADYKGFHLYVIVGVVGASIVVAVLMGIAGASASDEWGRDKCRELSVVGSHRKSSVFVVSAAALGSMAAIGVWDTVIAINILMDRGWTWAVLNRRTLAFDFLWIKIYWPLWLHVVVGWAFTAFALILAFVISSRIRRGEYCEPF